MHSADRPPNQSAEAPAVESGQATQEADFPEPEGPSIARLLQRTRATRQDETSPPSNGHEGHRYRRDGGSRVPPPAPRRGDRCGAVA